MMQVQLDSRPLCLGVFARAAASGYISPGPSTAVQPAADLAGSIALVKFGSQAAAKNAGWIGVIPTLAYFPA